MNRGVPHPDAVGPLLGEGVAGEHGVVEVAGASAQEKLRLEATTATHKLTHLPKNPYCPACQLGKMKQRYTRRSAFRRQLTKWGEFVTHLLQIAACYRHSQRTCRLRHQRPLHRDCSSLSRIEQGG